MECIRWREAISALADGERAEIDGRLVLAHVASCAACRGYQQSIEGGIRHSSAGPVDLGVTVSRLNAAADRARHSRLLRWALGAVAAQVVVGALPALVLGEEHATSTHEARHLGAFGVAYGVALLVVVVRPARARSILPVALVLAGAQVVAAVADLVSGRIPAVGEMRHIPQVASVVLIWFLATPSTRGGGSGVKQTNPPRLRVVDDGRRAG